MRKVLVLALNLITFVGFAQFNVGHTTITFNDPSRIGGVGSGGGPGRQIQTEIYYPAATAGDNVTVATGEFPVIVFGHGFVMTWDSYANIWERYAPQGYIVAFPKTEGGFSPVHNDFALDLNVVEQSMLGLNSNGSSLFYQKINGNTGLMGHSMGGGASVLAASGNTSIKTVVGLAPAETTPSAITAASGVTVPALIFSGSGDGVTPPNDHHIPIYNSLGSSCKNFVSITGGGHCYFANPSFTCDFGESGTLASVTITRNEQHTISYAFLDKWLAYTLKNDCPAFDDFILLMSSATGTTSQGTCTHSSDPWIIANGLMLMSSFTGVSYQWYLDGNPILGANAVQYTQTQTGFYTVEVTYENGCVKVSPPYQVTQVSIEEFTETLPLLIPNPTKGLITISNLSGIPKNISVMDLSGKEQPFTLSGQVLDLNAAADGIYLIKINNHYYRIIKGH